MKDFDRYADTQINGANSRETNRHMWNRAHLKALKLAAIVAVGLNPHYPVVDLDCAQWATDLVVRDITNILERFERGEVGGAQWAQTKRQIADMIGVITRFMRGDGTDAAKYGIPGNMHMQGVFTLTALTRRLMAIASFRNDRMGATNAIKRAVQHLLDGDEIRELPKVANEYDVRYDCARFHYRKAFDVPVTRRRRLRSYNHRSNRKPQKTAKYNKFKGLRR
jgi:hypothetical protein